MVETSNRSDALDNLTGLQRSKKVSKQKEKTVEERYQKKTPLEHILHRPESYIGSIQHEEQTVWVWSSSEERIVSKAITFVPGLYKIFDEILVNAADVKARESHEHRTSSQTMTYIKVNIDIENSLISIQNDGEGIPVQVHQEYNVYVPELIFGHLHTSDNYDDTELRVTGGRNGYGAKLTNIFSTMFTVECADTTTHRKFTKTWRKNMTQSDPCVIVPYKDKKDYVKVTFSPDLQRFQLTSLDDDFVSLLTKRVYDVAGCCSLKVWLNELRLPIDNFKSYVDLYFPKNESLESGDESTIQEKGFSVKIHEKAPRWEVVISMSEGQFQQVSFVNAIATLKGGTHVNYVTDPLIQAILKKVLTKNKGGMDLKAYQIRAHLWIFLNALIVNPTFDSQAKETLTTKPSHFGSSFTFSEKTLSSVIKSEIVDTILLWTQMKQQVELQKKLKGAAGRSGRDRVTGIPKLEDANDAGTKYSNDCTLILTEGESAKTSCIAGLSVVGRDRYGVYSLRGKPLNVREASFRQQVDNQEIQAILKIMGLQVGKKFESPKGLRYGKLMLMTDQDLDGSHIKGLLINMVAHYWPDLLKYEAFLKEFVTPIVKVTKNSQQISFFTLREYEVWKTNNENGKGWKTRYYKGLGTSSDREFKEYFSQLPRHTLNFVYKDKEDLDAIDMAFNAKRAEDRKQWIQNYQDGDFVDHSQATVSYKDFIYKELVQFSRYDVVRSIPNCIDGLKPVQRKVLFASFKRNLKSDIKIAQFVGYISECTAYHHGEQSLGTTIIGMAQNFVGSNNLNLLLPSGQFGSRKEGGKDASAIRYIYTRLSKITRTLFPEADDPLLDYQNDDGFMVEPKYYVPIIPFALVNGVEGIGTGWSSSIPNYNPRDLIENIRLFLRGESMNPISPWYKNFQGSIVEKNGGYESVGKITQIDDETLLISELPVKVWTQNYKLFLEDLLTNNSTTVTERSRNTSNRVRPPGRNRISSYSIVDYRDNSSHETIHFTIKVTPESMIAFKNEGLEKVFKLRKPISTMNMTLFDSMGKVQRYCTELDIIREFANIRYQYYELRRSYIIEKLIRECRILKNKVRFIQEVIDAKLIISNRKKEQIVDDLIAHKFDSYTTIMQESVLINRLEKKNLMSTIEPENEQAEAEADAEAEATTGDRDYEYLLSMSLWFLTYEKINELKAQSLLKQEQMTKFQSTTPTDLWEEDLKKFEEALTEQDRFEESERLGNQLKPQASSSSSKKTGQTSLNRKRKNNVLSAQPKKPENSDSDDSNKSRSLKQHTIQSKKLLNNIPSSTKQAPVTESISYTRSLLKSLPDTSNSIQNTAIGQSQHALDTNLVQRIRGRKQSTATPLSSTTRTASTGERNKTLEELLGITRTNSIHHLLNETNSTNEAPMKHSKKRVEKQEPITRNRSGKSTRKTKVIDSLSDASEVSNTSETSFESIPFTSSNVSSETTVAQKRSTEKSFETVGRNYAPKKASTMRSKDTLTNSVISVKQNNIPRTSTRKRLIKRVLSSSDVDSDSS